MSARSIVLSLHQPWARAIASGEKQLEFRRVWSRQAPPYELYIYETLPVAALSAMVSVVSVHTVSAETMESLQSRLRFPNTASRVLQYLRGSGFALQLSGYRALPRPLPLSELRLLGFTPPQNYAYLDAFPRLQAALEDEVFKKALAPDAASREDEAHQLSDQSVGVRLQL